MKLSGIEMSYMICSRYGWNNTESLVALSTCDPLLMNHISKGCSQVMTSRVVKNAKIIVF